jgi:hypothetical protein
MLTDPLDLAYAFADPIIWSVIETSLGTVVVSLPCLTTLVFKRRPSGAEDDDGARGEAPFEMLDGGKGNGKRSGVGSRR